MPIRYSLLLPLYLVLKKMDTAQKWDIKVGYCFTDIFSNPALKNKFATITYFYSAIFFFLLNPNNTTWVKVKMTPNHNLVCSREKSLSLWKLYREGPLITDSPQTISTI